MNPNFQRGILLYQQDRYELAATEFRQVLAGDSSNSDAHAYMALCLTELKEFKQATDEAQQAVHHDPDSDFAHYTLARVFYYRNRFDEALEHINEAIRIDPWSPRNFSLLAGIHMEERRWPAALEAAERGLQCDPEHVGCNNLRAMALVKLGRRSEAGATIEGALAKNPENSITHANKGWALLEAGQHEKALEHFREALRLDPTNDWARHGIVESLKARSFIYSWMLRYFFWMSKLSSRAQWGVILGAYFGNRILSGIAKSQPATAPAILVIKILYMIFVVLTWTADPLFNLLLRLNRFGRLALSREQIFISNWIGGSLALACLSLLVWVFTWHISFIVAAAVFGFLIMPLAGTFKCQTKWARLTMAAYTLGVAACGLSAAALMGSHSRDTVETGISLITFFSLGIFLGSWVANALGMVREKH